MRAHQGRAPRAFARNITGETPVVDANGDAWEAELTPDVFTAGNSELLCGEVDPNYRLAHGDGSVQTNVRAKVIED